jgi:hypothetical protein
MAAAAAAAADLLLRQSAHSPGDCAKIPGVFSQAREHAKYVCRKHIPALVDLEFADGS